MRAENHGVRPTQIHGSSKNLQREPSRFFGSLNSHNFSSGSCDSGWTGRWPRRSRTLATVIDRFSQCVIAWRLSSIPNGSFCLKMLDDVLVERT